MPVGSARPANSEGRWVSFLLAGGHCHERHPGARCASRLASWAAPRPVIDSRQPLVAATLALYGATENPRRGSRTGGACFV